MIDRISSIGKKKSKTYKKLNENRMVSINGFRRYKDK